MSDTATTHLTVRAWALMLGRGHDGCLTTLQLPPDTLCCTGLAGSFGQNISLGLVGLAIPTCPECAMLRESLLLALEQWGEA